ncbi:LamG domain-containing protein, partial [Arsenicibacter rosenii]|uniref:LamG domain-containing protein n=1 Tax=Arsenicibacter rosenii TaxID=1750698 RepID=UPI000A6E2CA4
KRDAGDPDKPVLAKTARGQVLELNGDTYADLRHVGVFRKSEPFTIGLRAWFPKGFKEGVIFHKSNAERLYNFKGYQLLLKNNKLEISMAHTAPSNAITRKSHQPVPRERWVHLTMSYDGSAKADGFRLFLDGSELPMETVIDQLYKDIIFYDKKNEPALQIGGWWRGLGFKGGKVDDIAVYNRTLTPFEIKVLANSESWKPIAGKSPDTL